MRDLFDDEIPTPGPLQPLPPPRRSLPPPRPEPEVLLPHEAAWPPPDVCRAFAALWRRTAERQLSQPDAANCLAQARAMERLADRKDSGLQP